LPVSGTTVYQPGSLRVCCTALLLRSVRALHVSVPLQRRFSSVRAVTPAPGPRFLVPDCLNYSLSPPLCAFCFPLSAFAVLVCRSPFRSVGRRLPCCASSPEAVADCVVPCCCLLSSRGLRVVAGLVRDRAPCSLEAGVGVRLGRNLWRLNVHPWRNFRLLLVARVAVV
jgi:hypothetical protein